MRLLWRALFSVYLSLRAARFHISVDCHGAVASSANTGPQGPEEGPFRRQRWLVSWTVPDVLMQTISLRPPGRGPLSRVVVNHGSIAKFRRPRRLASRQIWIPDPTSRTSDDATTRTMREPA